MIIINTISDTKFSYNGINYHKNFMPFVTGNKIAIVNVYDACITLTDAPTLFSEYVVNGVTYTSVANLQASLLDIVYTRLSLGTISGTGTVTNVSLALGSTGTDVNGIVLSPTTTPVINLNFPTASATNRGVLSAYDWSFFYGKQDNLGFTPYNATNPAGYITSASLEPLEFNTFDKTVWNNGKGNVESNTSFGQFALSNNTSGQNTAFGFLALRYNTSGSLNTAFGDGALRDNTTGSGNTAIGSVAGLFLPGGGTNTICSSSVFLGGGSTALANNQTNQIVIGASAIGLGSNTTVLGNTNTSFGRWWGNLLIGNSTNSGQALQVTGNMKLTGTLTNGTFTYTLPSAAGTLALTSDLHNAVTIGTANGLTLSTQVLSLGLASGSANGALSSTDWTTFNNKQNALTNPITGSGTTNFLPKFTGATTLGNSQIFDNGTNVGIGTTSPSQKLDVNGNLKLSASSSFLYGGDNVGRLIFANNDVTTYAAIYGSSHTTVPNLFQIIVNNIAAFSIPNTGNVGIGTTTPTSKLHVVGLSEYATNASAIAGGLTVGAFYHTGGVLKVVI